MNPKRTNGFVVGFDRTPRHQKVWKVRVKDDSSPYNGHKLVVVSVRGEMELAQGINVDFVIGTVDDTSGGTALRAIDVEPRQPAA